MSVPEPRPTACDVGRVLRAEWRRLREPPELAPVVRDALRSRPWTIALVVPGVLAAVGLSWWLSSWAAVPVTLLGLWFLGQLANRPVRGRTPEEFADEQDERVVRIRERHAARTRSAEDFRRRRAEQGPPPVRGG